MRPTLTVDLGMQFGRACITNTRTPADCLAECVFAGDSVDHVADSYGVTREDVLLSCWFMLDEMMIRPKSRRTKRENDLVERFGNWAIQVAPSLAQYEWAVPAFDPVEESVDFTTRKEDV